MSSCHTDDDKTVLNVVCAFRESAYLWTGQVQASNYAFDKFVLGCFPQHPFWNYRKIFYISYILYHIFFPTKIMKFIWRVNIYKFVKVQCHIRPYLGHTATLAQNLWGFNQTQDQQQIIFLLKLLSSLQSRPQIALWFAGTVSTTYLFIMFGK